MTIFAGLTALIYLAAYCIFKWNEDNFGGKIPFKKQISGRESARLKM
jgi:hypothetical protein